MENWEFINRVAIFLAIPFERKKRRYVTASSIFEHRVQHLFSSIQVLIDVFHFEHGSCLSTNLELLGPNNNNKVPVKGQEGMTPFELA